MSTPATSAAPIVRRLWRGSNGLHDGRSTGDCGASLTALPFVTLAEEPARRNVGQPAQAGFVAVAAALAAGLPRYTGVSGT